MNLCNCREDVRKKVHTVIDKFAERGLRSLAVARQVRDWIHYQLSLSFFFFGFIISSPESMMNSLFLILLVLIPWQEVPEKTKESAGGPWQFVGLLPLFDPPRHDSAETIRRALNLGVNVKMITGN